MNISKIRCSLFVAFFSLCTTLAYAQYNLKPAVVRLADGSMIQAFIGDNDDNLYKGYIDLYTSRDGERERLSPYQVTAININNEKLFYSLPLSEFNDEVRLVKFAHQGSISLGSYKGQLYVYSGDPGDRVVALQEPEAGEPSLWRGVLNSFLGDCPDIYPQVRSRGYSYKKLISVFEYYWNCTNSQTQLSAFDKNFNTAIISKQEKRAATPALQRAYPEVTSITDLPQGEVLSSVTEEELAHQKRQKRVHALRFSVGLTFNSNFTTESLETSRLSGTTLSDLKTSIPSVPFGVQARLFLDKPTNKRFALIANYMRLRSTLTGTVTQTGASAGVFDLRSSTEIDFREIGFQYFFYRNDFIDVFGQLTYLRISYEDEGPLLAIERQYVFRAGVDVFPIPYLVLTASVGLTHYDYFDTSQTYDLAFEGHLPFQLGAAIVFPK